VAWWHEWAEIVTAGAARIRTKGCAIMTDRAQETKAVLRRTLRSARRGRSPDDVRRGGDRLAELVCGLPEVAAARRLAAYLSRPLEPSTAELLKRWRAERRAVLLPVVLADLDLDWALDDADDRTADDTADDEAPGTGRIPGLREPAGARLGTAAIAEADVVVVPALAVDRRGTRLGQGGGSYDRALARRKPGALVVALLHPDELVDGPLPHEPHDCGVDVVVTPHGVARLTRRARA
jgi:5-formyltetrahydrofolate cyclo-ligase